MQEQNSLPASESAAANLPAPRVGGRGEDALGGRMSISPPAKVKTTLLENIHPLASGIDTLYLAIDILWPSPAFFTYLRHLKSIASETETAAPGQVADWIFTVQPYGRRGYEWLLESCEFTWRVGSWIKPQTRPSVIVEIRSETLWHLGARQAVDRVLSLLNFASMSDLSNPTILSVKASRADFCLDLLIPGNEWQTLQSFIVCRAQNIRSHFKGQTLTGISIGKGNLSARIYDKPLEIATKGMKGWMYDIWGMSEPPPGMMIVRVEFQLLREVLKELDIHTDDDLFRLERNAWAYCTQNWLKLQDRPGTHHTQRQTLPWWEIVQNGYHEAQGACPLVRNKAVRTNCTQLISQAYGLLSSLTAIQLNESGKEFSASADFNDCLFAVFETVGLLGKNNNFSERVRQKRAHYQRMQSKTAKAQELRREFDLLNDHYQNNHSEGGNHEQA